MVTTLRAGIGTVGMSSQESSIRSPPYAAVRAAGRAAAHAAAGTAATAEFHSYAHYRGRVRTNSNATEKIRELSGPRKVLPIKARPAGTMRDRKPGRTALSVPRIVPAGRSRN